MLRNLIARRNPRGRIHLIYQRIQHTLGSSHRWPAAWRGKKTPKHYAPRLLCENRLAGIVSHRPRHLPPAHPRG